MTSLVTWLCSQVRFCSLWRNHFVIEKVVNVVWSTMVWAISDCPGTEQNINIKGTIYNFQKVGVWVQVLSRVALNARKQKFRWILVDIFMKYTFLSFLILWRHRSRDHNGPKFNIRSKSLLEPFSKNIFKRSCCLINRVLKNGHDYFFLKKCGSRKSNWKVCQLPGQRQEERAWRKERKRGFTFARFLFTATPRHKRLARKKIPRTGQRTGLAFSLNGTFEDFFNYFFMAAVCSGTMYTWEGKLIQIAVAVC